MPHETFLFDMQMKQNTRSIYKRCTKYRISSWIQAKEKKGIKQDNGPSVHMSTQPKRIESILHQLDILFFIMESSLTMNKPYLHIVIWLGTWILFKEIFIFLDWFLISSRDSSWPTIPTFIIFYFIIFICFTLALCYFVYGEISSQYNESSKTQDHQWPLL